ncbi:hypothetical protein COO72_12420 [Bifidobacterium callitrichos]|nr:hypothetical protein COO72_12420 [Bifidobacterium callitrichos]
MTDTIQLIVNQVANGEDKTPDTKQMTPLERHRARNREYQRKRRQDPAEREKDREYQRKYYREHKEAVLARIKRYRARKKTEWEYKVRGERNDVKSATRTTGRLGF